METAPNHFCTLRLWNCTINELVVIKQTTSYCVQMYVGQWFGFGGTGAGAKLSLRQFWNAVKRYE
eukprot:10978387-Ditylum_brightwellii.AAC.1